MGLLTLAGFRQELTSVLSDRDDLTGRIDGWVNFGYLDVTGAVDFEELYSVVALSTVGYTAALPAGARTVISIHTADHLLAWLPKVEFLRQRADNTGERFNWTRIGSEILFSPVNGPMPAVSALVKSRVEPLVADGDVTLLPETWDLAVLQLSISYALTALGEASEGTIWYNRGLAYMQSRALDERRDMLRPGLGAQLRPDLRLGET